jgi:hypothetical protein
MWMKWLLIAGVLGLVPAPAWAEGKTAAPAKPASYVKLKVEVEICGKLSCTDKGVTVTVSERDYSSGFLAEKDAAWELDLSGAKELLQKAKDLHGKPVVVQGVSVLLGVGTQTRKVLTGCATPPPTPVSPPPPPPVETEVSYPVLVVEHKVKVTTLEAVAQK